MLINIHKLDEIMEKLLDKMRMLLVNPPPKHAHELLLPLLSKEAYAPIAFSPKNYNPIPELPSQNAIAFIDGGHAILLDAPHLCVAFLRAHAVVYQGKKRLTAKTIEAYLVVSSSYDQEIFYRAEILPLEGEFSFEGMLSFDSMDATIRSGTKRCSPTAVVGVARRFAELQLAISIMQSLSDGDMVILDGNLQQSYTNEQHLLEELRSQAQQRNIALIGVGKTNSLFASNGSSFSSLLSEHPGLWQYFPVAQPLVGAPHISFARFHPKSRHIFMLESFGQLQLQHLSALLAYSNDPVFLGYPYGLIEADRAARVSLQEADSLQFQLKERLGKSFETLSLAKNAHGILDKISF